MLSKGLIKLRFVLWVTLMHRLLAGFLHNQLIQLVVIFNCSLLHINSLGLSTVLLLVFALPHALFSTSFFELASTAKKCVILPPVSNHCPTPVALQLRGMPKSKPVTYYSWNFEQAEFDQLRAALDVIDWSAVLNSHDVGTAVATWSNLVLSCVQKFVPLKKHCHRPNNRPWYSPFLHKPEFSKAVTFSSYVVSRWNFTFKVS